MTEWRDSEKWAANDKSNTYANVTHEIIETMTDRIDGMMKDHIQGAVEGVHDYKGNEDGSATHRVTFEYNDLTTNAYQMPVVTDTVLEIKHNTYKRGVMVESYDIAIARQIIVEGSDKNRVVHPPFVEHYTFLTFKANERQAFVNQRDLMTEHGVMSETPMTAYDQSVLVAELDKIVGLYDTDSRERAIME